MGEGWLRHLAMVQGVRAKVDSAGTSAHHVGEGPDRRSISAMRAVDIDISGQRSRQFERNDFKNFDRILVMDQANLWDVLSMAKTEQDRAKVALFDPTGASVPDPYYGGADGFTEVREQVRRAAEAQLASVPQ